MRPQFKNKPTLFLAALLIGSQFYESWWREEALKKSICSCEIEEIKFSETEIQVILLRYCMHLIPGIGAGIWICTPKVLLIALSRTPLLIYFSDGQGMEGFYLMQTKSPNSI